jgi:hypothetical protein
MAAGLISNALITGLIGLGKRKQLPWIGTLTGMAAGIGGLKLILKEQ